MYWDDEIGNYRIEEDDQCHTCKHHVDGVECPLLEALANGIVELCYESIRTRNCGFYEKAEKPVLGVIKGGKQ